MADPDRVDGLLADWRYADAGVLEGLYRVAGGYPTLAPGGETERRLLVTPELDALDANEGVERGRCVHVALPLVDVDDAWVYVGDPDRLDAPVDSPGDGRFETRVEGYLASAPVRLRRAGNR